MQDKLKLCSVCSNRNSSNTDQLVINNDIANMTDEVIEMKHSTSSFTLDGLSNTLGENSTSGTASVSVSKIICDT